MEVSDVALFFFSLFLSLSSFSFSKTKALSVLLLVCVRKSFKSGSRQFESRRKGGSRALQTQDQGRAHVLGSGFVSGKEEEAPITKEGRSEVHDSIAAARYNKQR